MLKRRVIPVLLLRNGFLVQSKGFKRYQNIGNPVSAVRRLSEWGADELVYLDISRTSRYDMNRDDLGHANRSNIFEILEDVSRMAFMPITMGGGIRCTQDIEHRLRVGADKVAVNTLLRDGPRIVEEAAKEFGSQCLVASIDVKLTEAGPRAFVMHGREDTNCEPVAWAQRAVDLGAGEILLNSIDRDGRRNGYDLEILRSVSESVAVPVIALGGVGEWSHFEEALSSTNVEAVAAANVFQFVDQSVYLAKRHLHERGYAVRRPKLFRFSRDRREIHD